MERSRHKLMLNKIIIWDESLPKLVDGDEGSNSSACSDDLAGHCSWF